MDLKSINTLTTVVIDARQFRSRMTKLGILIQSSEIAKVAGLDILAWVADNFQSEGRAGGGPGWRPLAPSTIARRRKGPRAGVRDRILQDTGRLKQSFIPGRPENVFRQFGGKGVDVGTTLKYAPYHEYGVADTSFVKKSGKAFYRVVERKNTSYVKKTIQNFRVVSQGIPQRKMMPTRDQAQVIAAKAIEAIIRERTKRI